MPIMLLILFPLVTNGQRVGIDYADFKKFSESDQLYYFSGAVNMAVKSFDFYAFEFFEGTKNGKPTDMLSKYSESILELRNSCIPQNTTLEQLFHVFKYKLKDIPESTYISTDVAILVHFLLMADCSKKLKYVIDSYNSKISKEK
ncbi:MAG: hypothetical protein OEW39_00490 [Deltaproteobacteria bacterium]|nr:hypothetical protein [Deltaproteobacteria bacterium]